MHNILLEIIDQKRKDLIGQMSDIPQELLNRRTVDFPSRKGLFKDTFLQAKKTALIAEIKFASPTNPNLGTREDLISRAKQYETAGATAISLITEKNFFKGDVHFIEQIRQKTAIPVLQKDFVIDAYQIYEAKSIGADALLLIARLLDRDALKSFVNLCLDLHIEPVVEIHNEEDLEKAVHAEPAIIAVNARNLETFDVNVDNACLLLRKIPDTFIKLGFSGITSSEEVKKYKDGGVKGVLIGTSLMQTENIAEFIGGIHDES